jgi:hypothetical protein
MWRPCLLPDEHSVGLIGRRHNTPARPTALIHVWVHSAKAEGVRARLTPDAGGWDTREDSMAPVNPECSKNVSIGQCLWLGSW